MKVGIHIYVERDPYQTIAHAVKEYGTNEGQLLFWDMSLYNENTLSEIKRACKDFDFTVNAIWCGWSGTTKWGYPDMYRTVGLVPEETRAQRVEDILMGARFANDLGVKTIVTHPGYIPDNPFDKVHIETVDAFRHICREIKKNGQRLAFETGELLPVTIVQVILEIGEGNVGVNFDPSNFTTGGRANAATAMELLAPWVFGMHAKDGVYPSGTSPKGKQVRVVGTGDVDFPAIIKTLKDHGFDGTIDIEHETASDNRDQDIRDSKAYLESIIASI